MSAEEHAVRGRSSPFPAAWGPPPDEEHRASWIESHVRRDLRDRATLETTRRQILLFRRRLEQYELDDAS